MEDDDEIVIDRLLTRTVASIEQSLSGIDVEARLEALRRRAATDDAEVAKREGEFLK